MKSSVNRFDYPTATSHTYKTYKDSKAKEVDTEAHKQKFRQFDKQQRDIERNKVQKEKEKKKQIEMKENKKKIKQQLQKKKQQLLELQKMKNMAIEAQKKSHQLALQRQQQQKKQKIEQQRKNKENQFNAQNRFLEALRRMEEDKQINSRKEREAVQRRKAAEQAEKNQRQKAIKYRQILQQKQRSYQPEQKCQFNNYKQTLGRTTYNRVIDYTKTFLHNPNIIIPSRSEQQNARERAERQANKQQEKSEQRKNKYEENKKISIERGKAALQRIALERQYAVYLKEQQEKAKNYNVERIEAGKKNQYVGMKPSTISQMEINKKIRGEEEFQQIFFGGQNPEWFDKPANRYNIVQNKLSESSQPAQSIQIKKNSLVRSIGSVGAVVSDSHYSFQSQSINDLTSVKKPVQQQIQKIQQKKRVIPLPKQMIEPVQQGDEEQRHEKKKEELSYSQSQDEDQHN